MRRLLGALGMVLSVQLIFPNQLLAKPGSVSVNQLPKTASSQAGAAASGVSLNLSSTHQSMSAALLNLSKSLYINVGGAKELVNSATMLTPAEYVAASQVAAGSVQTLSLGAGGNAVGGRMSLTSSLASSLSNLVIPQGVKLFDNFGSLGTLQLSGNLVDAGKFVAISTNPLVTSAVIDANNIYVEAGGMLTSVLGASHSGLNSSLSLNLNALNNVVNQGAIASSGNLSVTAGGAISNGAGSGTVQHAGSGSNGAAGSMQAQGDVSLFAAGGSFVNGGTITSSSGNININSLAASDITFNGTGGTLSAQNGAVNFRSAGYAGSANLAVNGGNYLSQALNLNSGTGSVDMNVDQVTGVVNTYAGSAHLSANTANLQLGVFDVTGDPYISNNGGDLDISATIANPVDYLVATAGGSIYTSVSGQSISTTGNGSGNIVLAAGVDSTDNSGAITLTRSGMGGDVLLANGTTINGNTSNDITGFTTSGGTVTLIAMTDTGSGSSNGGHVVLPSGVTITTDNTGREAPVTILAEASVGAGDAVSIIGGISADSSFSGAGTIIVKSATANLAGATISDSDGSVTGSFDSNVLQNGNVTTGQIGASGSLTVGTKGTINLLAGTYRGSSVSLTATNVALNQRGYLFQ